MRYFTLVLLVAVAGCGRSEPPRQAADDPWARAGAPPPKRARAAEPVQKPPAGVPAPKAEPKGRPGGKRKHEVAGGPERLPYPGDWPFGQPPAGLPAPTTRLPGGDPPPPP